MRLVHQSPFLNGDRVSLSRFTGVSRFLKSLDRAGTQHDGQTKNETQKSLFSHLCCDQSREKYNAPPGFFHYFLGSSFDRLKVARASIMAATDKHFPHLVVPGQIFAVSTEAEDSFLRGHGTYLETTDSSQVLRASVTGNVQRVNKLISVGSVSIHQYFAQVGD
jgi:hypothetical protein